MGGAIHNSPSYTCHNIQHVILLDHAGKQFDEFLCLANKSRVVPKYTKMREEVERPPQSVKSSNANKALLTFVLYQRRQYSLQSDFCQCGVTALACYFT